MPRLVPLRPRQHSNKGVFFLPPSTRGKKNTNNNPVSSPCSTSRQGAAAPPVLETLATPYHNNSVPCPSVPACCHVLFAFLSLSRTHLLLYVYSISPPLSHPNCLICRHNIAPGASPVLEERLDITPTHITQTSPHILGTGNGEGCLARQRHSAAQGQGVVTKTPMNTKHRQSLPPMKDHTHTQKKKAEPVSYTHLTLPTSDLV